ncbi:hypothetical protein ACIP98_03055 [Streptomyces sp. NPDC088354]|uniref:hypothetical protein n=1 Tax=Streptomyces sp. NPDC088354 TaxID=3365856 RepID=UPI003821F13B
MATIDPSFRRRLWVESLTVLAADPSVQVEWLDKYGVPTDEIALDFDHAFLLTGQLVEEGQLSRDVLPDLHDIDVVLNEMSGDQNAARWAKGALFSDPGWIKARQLARRILIAEFGEWRAPMPDICVIR